MSTELKAIDKAPVVDVVAVMEKVLLAGDLARMDPKDRIDYYMQTCNSLYLNPMTKPFDLITLNGKMVLYPNRSCTDQLRARGCVDLELVKQVFDKDTGCYEVTARAKLPNGRSDEDMGIVFCANVRGEQLANAKLKAVTKAKRRVTLSIIGLGWVDESEAGNIKGAKFHKIDLKTGAVIDVDGPLGDTPGNEQKGVKEVKAQVDSSKSAAPAQSTVIKPLNASPAISSVELKRAEWNKLKARKEERQITDDEFMPVVKREIGHLDWNKMSLADLQKLNLILETYKTEAEVEELPEPGSDEEEEEWLKETPGGPAVG